MPVVAPPSPPPPPPPPPTVIRISTDLVQLDAVVTDRAGRPVTDLTPADFEVVEGGRRRQVTHVTYVRPGEPRGGVQARRTVVFLVDDLHLQQRGIVETRDLLSSFARKHLGPTDLVGDRQDVRRRRDGGCGSPKARPRSKRPPGASASAAAAWPETRPGWPSRSRRCTWPWAVRTRSRRWSDIARPARPQGGRVRQPGLRAVPPRDLRALDALYGDATLEAGHPRGERPGEPGVRRAHAIDPSERPRSATLRRRAAAPRRPSLNRLGSTAARERQSGLLDLALPTGGSSGGHAQPRPRPSRASWRTSPGTTSSRTSPTPPPSPASADQRRSTTSR